MIYSGVSLSVAAQDSGPNGIYFKFDGTKMYVIGTLNAKVYQYSLSTPWDLSTATYDGVSFSIASQSVGGFAVHFKKDDGTKMYALATTANRVYQYSLSTPWDISTATYATKSFSFAGQDAAKGMFFKSDGSKVYMVGDFADSVWQYSLSSPWDISTASYDTVTVSVAGQDTAPTGLYINDDGDELYITGDSSNSVHKYTLPTPWVLTGMTLDSSASVASQDTAPSDLFFKYDLSKMYLVGSQQDRIFQYALN
jgi:sugar lactone lactonase YvrE